MIKYNDFTFFYYLVEACKYHTIINLQNDCSPPPPPCNPPCPPAGPVKGNGGGGGGSAVEVNALKVYSYVHECEI
jgi:hypothetical protein